MEATNSAFPRNLSEAQAVVANNLMQVYVLLFCLLLGLYPLVVPANLRYNKRQLQQSALYRCKTGQGLAPLEFCYFSLAVGWLLLLQVSNKVILYWVCFAVASWTFPFKDAGELFKVLGKWIGIVGKAREQVFNTVPYIRDLFPQAKKLLPHWKKTLENIDVLGPAMPALMEEKEYILPVLPELMEKLDILVPIIPDIVPHIHKIAPHMELLLPSLELMAPHIKRLLPLWDELEPRLPILVANIENLAPYLDDTVPYMDRLIPVLDLLPMVHDSGVLNFDLACKALPITARMLPQQEGFQRNVLHKFSSTLADKYVQGQQYLKENDSKWLPWIEKLKLR